MADPKADLHRYLQQGREAVVAKLDGLGEYDARRPLVPTGTNLLGLVKHLAAVELGYLGDTFGRPGELAQLWADLDTDPLADMWVPAEESRDEVLALYHLAWEHGDATITALPLDAPGRVPWWPEERAAVTLHQVLVHLVAETHRHAGHADLVRELIDGAAGRRPGDPSFPDQDATRWRAHYLRVEEAARRAGGEEEEAAAEPEGVGGEG